MRLRRLILAFALIFFFLPLEARGADYNYTKISEIFFPETRDWINIESAQGIGAARLSVIKKKLRSAYFEAHMSGRPEDERCPFIGRALDDRNVKFFRLIDIDSNGVLDLIYTGPKQCAEGDVFLAWFGKNLRIRQTVLWGVRGLKISPGKAPRLSSVAVGCCGDHVDTYYLGGLDSPLDGKTVRTAKSTVFPEKVLAVWKRFRNENETVLRSSPVVNDAYDKQQSHALGLAVFGNVLSKFSGGVSGNILAEHSKGGRRWVYVILDKESDTLRYHSPFKVNAGWVALDSIKESK